MITGFNTDVGYNGKVYHVQTEDKGVENPFIESMIYLGGAILFSKRTGYADKLTHGIMEKEIRALMETQHRTVIAAIRKGRFGPDTPNAADHDAAGAAARVHPAPPPTSPKPPEALHTIFARSARSAPAHAVTPLPARPAPAPPPVVTEAPSKASLDEMIKAYLMREKEKDTLNIKIPHGVDFYAGSVIPFAIKAETSSSRKPVPGVEIVAKLITTFGPSQDLFTGYTGPEGTLTMTLKIPGFKQGNAAIIIMGKSKEYGNTEYKQLVKKKG